MAEYQLTVSDTVFRVIDNSFIPNNPNNVDRVAFDAWIADGGVPDPYVSPPIPIPQIISDWQFFYQLSVEGIISMDEALASNAAVIPPPLLALIDAMPADEQDKAKMLISGATQFQRSHPLTIAIGTAYGWSSDQIDAFFVAAFQL